jgi:hypothetical protein
MTALACRAIRVVPCQSWQPAGDRQLVKERTNAVSQEGTFSVIQGEVDGSSWGKHWADDLASSGRAA